MTEIEDQYWHVSQEYYQESLYGKKSQEELEYLADKSVMLFSKLFDQENIPEPYYWMYCTAKCYKATYESRLKDFLKNTIDEEEIDFLMYEYQDLFYYQEEKDSHSFNLPHKLQTDEKIAFEKKREFLDHKLSVYNYSTKENHVKNENGQGFTRIIDFQKLNPSENITSDKSTESAKQLDTISLVYFFEKSGIINQLYKNGHNKEFIYKKISLITGRNIQNIKQKYLTIVKEGDNLINSINSAKTKESLLEIEELFKTIEDL